MMTPETMKPFKADAWQSVSTATETTVLASPGWYFIDNKGAVKGPYNTKKRAAEKAAS